MSGGRRAAVGIGAVAVVVAAAVAFLLWPRGTTEISEKDAVEDFREKKSTDTTATEGKGTGTPAPGVYTYSAEGQERVKLGPLPAQDRPLPSTVTAVVTDTGPGCFQWTVNLFAEHTEDTTWCTNPSLRMEEHAKHQTIGAISPTATMTCDPNQLPAAGGTPTELPCTLKLSGGPMSVTATFTGTATAKAGEAVDVGGTKVETTPIEIRYPVSGDINGTWVETTWWSRDHLPIRVTRALELAGTASFTENTTLQLTSLEPTS